MSLSSSKRTSFMEMLRRVPGYAYHPDGFSSPGIIEQNPAALSGEYVLSVNTANSPASPANVPTGTVALIGINSSDQVVLPNGASVPAGKSVINAFGSGTGTFEPAGNINLQVSSAGVNPGATGADNVLAVFSLPANSFDVAGREIIINANGSFGATGNNKRIKIIVNPATAVVGSTVGAGGTTICDTGTVATNGGGWDVSGSVVKYGAAGSNTQLGIHQQAQCGASVSAMLAPSAITAVESGAILIAITGNATTATTDIVFNMLQIIGLE